MSMLTQWAKKLVGLPPDAPGKVLVPAVLYDAAEIIEAHAADWTIWIDMAVPLPAILEAMDGPAIGIALHGLAEWLKAQAEQVGRENDGDG